MKINSFIKIGLLFLLIPLFTLSTYAKGDIKSKDNSLKKTTGTPSSTRFNINKIGTYIYNDGRADVIGSSAGYFYPILGGNTANFQSGFLWGGYVGDVADNKLDVGGAVYRTALTPGRILPSGVAESATLDGVRIYRVRKDYKTGSLSQEAQDEVKSVEQVYAQYEKDWNEWPGDAGAPFTYGLDAAGVQRTSGSYNPNFDIPGVKGADQTIWYVANDLSTTQTSTFYGATPMGIEMQCTVWGYKQAGALGQMLFKRYIMINKNPQGKAFNKFYVAYWSDTDIGGGSFDLIGCDTTSSLFYTYSGVTSNVQYGTTPPATGFDFFQGPRYHTGNLQDSAVWKGKWIKGWKNYGLTAHTYFINSSATLGDPDQGSAQGIKQWYNLFEGKGSITGAPFVDPSGKPSKFLFSGDPVTGTGWLDSNPADRRNEGISGPFTLAYGDTQEVVVAQMSAGGSPGIDNIGAVRELKRIDQIAQVAFDRFFELPTAAPMQAVKISPYDKKVILNWAWDAVTAQKTENFSYKLITPGDTSYYNFQGYNVYQLPTKSASLSEAIKLKTFDIIDTVTSITDLSSNNEAGLLLPVVVENGSNSGLQRVLVDSVDAFTKAPLVNGTEYYFAVTSYSYNPSPQFGTKVLENPLTIITVIPQALKPGTILNSQIGTVVPVTRTAGSSDGVVKVTVTDPLKVLGAPYKVKVAIDASQNTTWSVLRRDTTVLSNQAVNSTSYVDGLLVTVTGPPVVGYKNEAAGGFAATAGTRRWTQLDGDGLGFEGWRAVVGYISPANYFSGLPMLMGPGEIHNLLFKSAKVTNVQSFAPVFDNTDANVSYGYRYMRSPGTPADPAFAPYMTRPTSGSYGFQEYAQNVPFSVWNIDDPANPKRLAVGFLENNNANGLVDGKYWPAYYAELEAKVPATDNTASTGPREWLFIMDDLYTGATPDNKYTATPLTSSTTARIMCWITWNRRDNTAWTGADQWALYANKPLAASDVFAFTSPSVGFDLSKAKDDVEKINVFPNPYYGVNPREINKYSRFVTFSHLPNTATIRIFNLAGQLVRTINKNSQDQFQQWDLLTDNNFPVASGLYIVYVDMPDLAKSKILKVAIIQEQQILDHF